MISLALYGSRRPQERLHVEATLGPRACPVAETWLVELSPCNIRQGCGLLRLGPEWFAALPPQAEVTHAELERTVNKLRAEEASLRDSLSKMSALNEVLVQDKAELNHIVIEVWPMGGPVFAGRELLEAGGIPPGVGLLNPPGGEDDSSLQGQVGS